MNPFTLLAVFVVATLLGYKIISHVPSLLHTPLMSAMNALSGVIILGAVTATHLAGSAFFTILGAIAVSMAIINVFGGFDITHKMLRMVAGRKR
ncbi:NAD(P) transhydrogenase subunit alpha [uncultured Desulfovibrio sp.]|uniref:NAD(P) transhydrogenase subunit alpha n=1 Tax=uncultured Desulfovibrio sp. TaxID=167968 RepID=UPI002601BEA7|nr:NAD(P) transhydrogenase subunit alpha [uncultured Desulfovibrio sp.]